MPIEDPVVLRPPLAEDEAEYTALNRASIALHHPWIATPTTPEAFAAYLARSQREDTACMLICERATGRIAGAVNLSQIFYGPLQSAYMGYSIGAAFAGRGYASAGVRLALQHAFGPLRLHRIEANIQPDNAASIALVRRLGFTREGFSRRYLFIDGDWRDHERWAILAEDMPHNHP